MVTTTDTQTVDTPAVSTSNTEHRKGRPDHDPRFTFGMLMDLGQVLEAHGYPKLTGWGACELQQHLIHFLYGRHDRCYGKRAPAADRCPDREEGSSLDLARRSGELSYSLRKAHDWLGMPTPQPSAASGTEAVTMHERMGDARFLIETLVDVLENELGVDR